MTTKWLWLAFIAILPIACAYAAGASKFGMVRDLFQHLPFDWGDAVSGFVVGLVLSGIVGLAALAVQAVFRRSRKEPPPT